MSEQKLTTYQILRNRFPENEYVLMCEVSDASGFSRKRSLDYMLVNLWESRGLAVTGIEKKSNRTDWLKELKYPAKQENHFKYCDYFYLLTDKDGVASAGEIPVTWGWYHVKGGRIITMKPAPKLSPEPIGRSLLCAMLRRAASKDKFIHRDTIEQAIEEATERKLESTRIEGKFAIDELAKLREKVKLFEDASGIDITYGWHHYWGNRTPETIGTMVKTILDNGPDEYIKRLEQIRESAVGITKSVDRNIKIAKGEIVETVKKNKWLLEDD